MAKRLTDSDKWKDVTFLRKLPAEYKLLWLYMWDDCDHSGIWHVDLDTAFTRLGIKFSLEKIRGLFAGKVVEFESGTKMFIPDFIAFQYGELNPSNKVHRSVLKTLEANKFKGLTSGLQAAMNKDKEMYSVLDNKGEDEKLDLLSRTLEAVLVDEHFKDSSCMNHKIMPDDFGKAVSEFWRQKIDTREYKKYQDESDIRKNLLFWFKFWKKAQPVIAPVKQKSLADEF